jgi:general secretion pathway protein F
VASAGESDVGAITLDQLIALNDEMAALIRAGVPLEQGLEALGGELPGQPGKLAGLLATRMSAGESLSQILSDEQHRFPPVWRAVVEAGLRSGHLASALESLSETARRTSSLRKTVGAGLLYPVVVVALAYAVFVFLVTWLIPLALKAQMDLTERADEVLAALNGLGRTASWWAIPVPLVAVVLLGMWWRRSGQALWYSRNGATFRTGNRRTRGRGGFRRALQLGRMATFTEVMALLVKQRVPLDDSVVLAAESSGDRTIAAASVQIAERLRRGEQFRRYEDLPPGLPPLMGWLLLAGEGQPDLSEALSRSAAVYRNRAARAATWTAVYLPISLTVFVGGTATLICALITFTPLLRMFYQLSWP